MDVEADHDVLRLIVHDDGIGGASFSAGSGLVGLKDRVEALGGRMTLHSERGAGTTLSVEVPLTRQEIGVDVSPGDNSIGQRRPEGSIEATQRTVSSGRLRSYTYGGSHPQQQRRPMTQETNDRPPTTTDAGIP